VQRSIGVDDADLDLDQALEGESTVASQKRFQRRPALFQHPEECFDRQRIIGRREEKEKQDQEKKIRVVSEIQLVGKEDVSLKEKERATRETNPNPKTEEDDEGILEVVQPKVGFHGQRLDEGQVGKVKSSFNGEQALAEGGVDFSIEEQGEEDAEQTQAQGAALGKPEGLPCPDHRSIRRSLLLIQFR